MTTIEHSLAAIWAHKVRFVLVFFAVFTALYTVLFVLDWLPEPRTTAEPALPVVAAEPLNVEIIDTAVEPVPADTPASVVDDSEPAAAPAVLPTSVYISKLDKTIEVLNPTSRTIADLDNALLSGVVRHPDSAVLNQTGNVFILGHSSYLPNVLNRNFQAFNGIQNLAWGDTIEVTGDTGEVYVYRVDEVYEATAANVTVPIAGEEQRLILATCDSFGSVDDRFIVEATLVSTKNT